MNINPQSVLDIGAGFGKYGLLCREYLELWDGRQNYSEFLRRIDAVEIFGNYVTPVYEFVYNNTYSQDIVQLAETLNFNYDLVLIIDVLEHLTKERGIVVLTKLLSKNRGLIISTPKKPSDQKDAFDNIYETHRSRWTKKEFRDLKKIAAANSFFINDNTHFILYIGKKEIAQKLKWRLKILRRIRKIPGVAYILPTAVRIIKKINMY